MKTESALCAKAIKKELTAAFPFIKFSVTSDNFSMGDAVRIHYTDGVKIEKITSITDKYQYGSFDGMQDLYENTNSRSDIPQAKYVQVERKRSDEADKIIIELLKKEVDPDFDPQKYYFNEWGSQLVWKKFYAMEFLPEQEQPKETTKINGSFQIVDYSEKAIAVFGDTKPIKDHLKQLGGRFNPFLNFNNSKTAGWVFSKLKRNEVETLLNGSIPQHKDNETFEIKEVNLSESLMNKALSTKEQAEKINTGVHGNWTNRRQRMADSQDYKKDNLLKIATILETLSIHWINNTIDNELKCIKTRSDVELLLYGSYPESPQHDHGDWYKKEYPARKKKVDSLGIKNKEHFNNIKSLVQNLGTIELTHEQIKQKELDKLMADIHKMNIPGFFPTPEPLIEQMIDISGIDHVNNILEPSAGMGSICDKIKDICDNLECCEQQYTLYEFLQKKGFNVIERNIFDIENRSNFYDAIFMNPPFEKREDLKHVMFCYNLLANSGKLVSIISAGTLTNEFNDWLTDKDYEIFDTPKDSFKSAFNSTGVQVKIILINK
jgi:hypothetical protein